MKSEQAGLSQPLNHQKAQGLASSAFPPPWIEPSEVLAVAASGSGGEPGKVGAAPPRPGL